MPIDTIRELCRGFALKSARGRGIVPSSKGARRFLRHSSGLRRAWSRQPTRKVLLRASGAVRGVTV